MTKKIENMIKKFGMYDTKKYRYILAECSDHAEIRRIEIDKLGTTEAINGWRVVKEYD